MPSRWRASTGRPLYEHPDPRRGEHKDWGTYIFDYGRNEVRNFLVANALYWFEEFHVDGLRVDAVASMLYLDYSREDGEWEPNIHGGRENLEAIGFLQEVNATAYKRYPGIAMIAEESTSYPGVTAPTSEGGLGFGFKWNMGWMNDSLQYIKRDPMYRSHHEGELSFSFVYAFSENFILPISHDEVVHGKGSLFGRMPGDHWQKLANMRAFLAYMWGHPGKQLLFMGQEFGQLSEWSEGRGLDWWMLDQPSHPQLQAFVAELNRVYRDHSALWSRDSDGAAFSRLGAPSWNPNVIAFSAQRLARQHGRRDLQLLGRADRRVRDRSAPRRRVARDPQLRCRRVRRVGRRQPRGRARGCARPRDDGPAAARRPLAAPQRVNGAVFRRRVIQPIRRKAAQSLGVIRRAATRGVRAHR